MQHKIKLSMSTRKYFGALLCAFILSCMTACEAKPMTINMNLMSFIYNFDRPIFDIYSTSSDGKATYFGAGGNGVYVDEPVTLGSQKVTWRYTDNGETVTAKNVPVLKDVPTNAQFLTLHIYPDNTVEFVFTEYPADPTPRGEQEYEKLRAKHHGE